MRNKTVIEKLIRDHPEGITRYELAQILNMRPADVLNVMRELRSEGKILMKRTVSLTDRRRKDFITE